jgi:hypothetical protein
MTVDRDDDLDALSWAGDEPVAEPAAPATPTTVLVEAPAQRGTPGILIVTYGILAGMYLLLTAGWFATVARSTTTLPSLFPEIMYQFGEFLAIASPALWFASVVLLTRGRRPIARLLLLLLGLVVILPWPFVLGV